MKKCTFCSKENPDDAIYCMSCGKSLEKQRKPQKSCPNCSGILPIDANNCVFCGYSFSDKKKEDNNWVEVPKEEKQPLPTQLKRSRIEHEGTDKLDDKTVENKQDGKKSSFNKKFFWGFVAFGILMIFINSQKGDKSSNTSSNNYASTRTPKIEMTYTPSKTATPIIIMKEDVTYIDGVSFAITRISRKYSTNKNDQIIDITYKVSSKNVPFTGYDFQAKELIFDLPNGTKMHAGSTTQECRIYDNETCTATATFTIPLYVSKVNLYYVSTRRFDDKEPIDITDPDDRRFLATINLSAIYLPPTPTMTATRTRTSTLTQTPTSKYTSTETLTPTITATFTKTLIPTATLIPSKTPVPPISLSSIYYNFEFMTSLQFSEYKNSIIGKKVDEEVRISNVSDKGVVSLYGPWKDDGYTYWEFCVVVLNVPYDDALDLLAGDYRDLTATINRFADNNTYYINCETTLVLSFISFND